MTIDAIEVARVEIDALRAAVVDGREPSRSGQKARRGHLCGWSDRRRGGHRRGGGYSVVVLLAA